MALKSKKRRNKAKFVIFLRIKLWKLCKRVKYRADLNFIDLRKDLRDLEAKNAKPHYANEIKVQLF